MKQLLESSDLVGFSVCDQESRLLFRIPPEKIFNAQFPLMPSVVHFKISEHGIKITAMIRTLLKYIERMRRYRQPFELGRRG